MNQSSESPSTPEKPAAQPSKSHSRRGFGFFFFFIVFVVVGAVGTGVALRHISLPEREQKLASPVIVQMPVKEAATPEPETPSVSRLDQMEERFNSLTARLDKLEQTPAVPEGIVLEGAPAPASNEELVRLKNEVVNLSGALSAVQMQLKQSEQAASQTRTAAQTDMAAFVAFMQLQAAATVGGGFASEAQTLRKVAGNDDVLKENLSALESLAVQGAPALVSLRESFVSFAVPARAAMRRAESRTWLERVKTALATLISVRPLHPAEGGEDVLGQIERDLAEHRLTDALDKVRGLPEAGQTVLDGWRRKAEARHQVDTALNAMAARLVERARGAADAAAPVPEPAAAPPSSSPTPTVP